MAFPGENIRSLNKYFTVIALMSFGLSEAILHMHVCSTSRIWTVKCSVDSWMPYLKAFYPIAEHICCLPPPKEKLSKNWLLMGTWLVQAKGFCHANIREVFLPLVLCLCSAPGCCSLLSWQLVFFSLEQWKVAMYEVDICISMWLVLFLCQLSNSRRAHSKDWWWSWWGWWTQQLFQVS